MKHVKLSLVPFLCSLAAIVWLNSSTALAQDTYGTMMIVKGDIKVASTKSGKTESGKVGFKVFAGDTIVSGSDSRAKIIMSDKNVLNISPDSKMTIAKYENNAAKDTRNVELKVDYGKVRASVEQNYDGEKNKFNIRTPTAVAGVRGTDFIAGFNSATRQTTVVTFTGVVAVGTPGPNGQIANAVFVKPNQQTSVSEGKTPESPKAVSKEQIQQMNQESKADTAKGGSTSDSSGSQAKGEETKKDDAKEEKKADSEKKSDGDKKADSEKKADGEKVADKTTESQSESNDKKVDSEKTADKGGDKPSDGGDKKTAASDKSADKPADKAATSENSGNKQVADKAPAGDSKPAETPNSGGSAPAASGTSSASTSTASGETSRAPASIPSTSTMVDTKDLNVNISKDIQVSTNVPKVPTTYVPNVPKTVTAPTNNQFIDNVIRNQKSRVRVEIILPPGS